MRLNAIPPLLHNSLKSQICCVSNGLVVTKLCGLLTTVFKSTRDYTELPLVSFDWYITISFVCHYKTEKTERNFSKRIIRQKKTLLQTYVEFEQSFSSTNLFSAERTREDRSASGEKRTTKPRDASNAISSLSPIPARFTVDLHNLHFRLGRISVPSLKKYVIIRLFKATLLMSETIKAKSSNITDNAVEQTVREGLNRWFNFPTETI